MQLHLSSWPEIGIRRAAWKKAIEKLSAHATYSTLVIPGEREARGKGTQVVTSPFSRKQNPSWPGLSRPSIFQRRRSSCGASGKWMAATVGGHDGYKFENRNP